MTESRTEVTFLLWNLKNKGKDYLSAITELYQEKKPEILLFIECDLDDKQVEILSNYYLRSVMVNNKKAIRLYVAKKLKAQALAGDDDFEILATDGKFRHIKEKIIFFKLVIGELKILLVGIHFPSKFNNSTTAQQQIIKRWRGWIEEQEAILDTDKTIIFGDFNLNPQEIAIYSHEGLSAHPSLNLKAKVKTKYYNPMWSAMGDFVYGTDHPKVPGTYFNDLSSDNVDQIHWNILDGLLIKNALVPNFSKKDLEIITGTKNHSYFKNGYIDTDKYSDHLPVIFKFKI